MYVYTFSSAIMYTRLFYQCMDRMRHECMQHILSSWSYACMCNCMCGTVVVVELL